MARVRGVWGLWSGLGPCGDECQDLSRISRERTLLLCYHPRHFKLNAGCRLKAGMRLGFCGSPPGHSLEAEVLDLGSQTLTFHYWTWFCRDSPSSPTPKCCSHMPKLQGSPQESPSTFPSLPCPIP